MTSHDRVGLCRFRDAQGAAARIGGVDAAGRIVDLSGADIASLADVLERDDPAAVVRAAIGSGSAAVPPASVTLLPPVERQEVWAAGVTYLRSKTARMEESDFSATAYDRVYDAVRPEIFFKAVGEKAIGPGEPLGIRGDARWNDGRRIVLLEDVGQRRDADRREIEDPAGAVDTADPGGGLLGVTKPADSDAYA